jgi:hypothetical protein
MTDVPRSIGVPSLSTTSSPIPTSITLSTSSTSSTTSSALPTAPPSNIGAIVGGSVGGALALCAIAVALAVIIVRKKGQTTTVDNAASYISVNSPTPYTGATYWNEVDGQGRPVSELPSNDPNMVVHNCLGFAAWLNPVPLLWIRISWLFVTLTSVLMTPSNERHKNYMSCS